MTDRATAGGEAGLVREQHGPVLSLRLDRPEARNALTPELLEALGRALLAAEEDPAVRALVLTGTGSQAFCAGMDLRAFDGGADMTAVDPAAYDAYMRLLVGDVRIPVVGAANGTALAGGLELLLGCDLIVASAEADLGLPEVRRGLFPGGSGTDLGRRVPLGIALEMTLTGRSITAARAHQLGLVNVVVAPDEVHATALDLAAAVAANAPLGVAACRELVRLSAVGDPATADRLAHWRSAVFGSEDAREGAAAFVERRDPVWQGR